MELTFFKNICTCIYRYVYIIVIVHLIIIKNPIFNRNFIIKKQKKIHFKRLNFQNPISNRNPGSNISHRVYDICFSFSFKFLQIFCFKFE
jgi:hypothetical protein